MLKLACSYIRKRWVGEEIWHYCQLTDTMCILSMEEECPIFEVEELLEETEGVNKNGNTRFSGVANS